MWFVVKAVKRIMLHKSANYLHNKIFLKKIINLINMNRPKQDVNYSIIDYL